MNTPPQLEKRMQVILASLNTILKTQELICHLIEKSAKIKIEVGEADS